MEGTRLRVRTGTTTPLTGKRRAWTEANTQAAGIGTWQSWNATALCVNAGSNTQTYSVCGGDSPCSTGTIETENPGNTCLISGSWHRVQTTHDRNEGKPCAGGFWTSNRLYSRGCASANVEGHSLFACALTHSRSY